MSALRVAAADRCAAVQGLSYPISLFTRESAAHLCFYKFSVRSSRPCHSKLELYGTQAVLMPIVLILPYYPQQFSVPSGRLSSLLTAQEVVKLPSMDS
jgi:hypothetical protein